MSLRAPCLALLLGLPFSVRAAEVIQVFVALADNASQGIAPVPAKIGDGDKPDANLYWGCDEGVKAWFTKSKRWKKLPAVTLPRADILERLVFKHVERDVYLIADAWRGREIRSCLQAFVNAAAGEGSDEVKAGELVLRAGGASSCVAYIGHNGLMEFAVDWVTSKRTQPTKPAIVLCCLSQSYFADRLKLAGAHPLLTTRQLMYPGAFILHDALEVHLAARSAADVHDAAARAYARNQGISVTAARGVFAAD